MLEAPGSYCAYACLYITCCLIKLFTLATNTYEEQHQHINALQSLSNKLTFRTFLSNRIDVESPMPQDTVAQAAPQWVVSEDDYSNLQDDGPIDIDEELNQEDSPNNNSEETVSPKNSDKPKEDSVLPKNDNNNSGFSSYFNFPLSINNFISRSRTTSYDDRANNPTETKIDEQELLLSEEKIASLAINIEEINSNNKNNAVTALSLGKIPIRNSSKVRLANSTSMSGRSVRSPKVRKGIKTLGSFNTTAGSTAYGNRVSNEDTSFKNTNDSMKESDKMSDIETGDDCSSNGTSAPPSISPNNVGVIDKDNKLSIQNPASLGKLPLVRGSSATAEAQGQAIADIISQIRYTKLLYLAALVYKLLIYSINNMKTLFTGSMILIHAFLVFQ